MYNGRQAYDTGTGQNLTSEDAEMAADNPAVFSWVAWR